MPSNCQCNCQSGWTTTLRRYGPDHCGWEDEPCACNPNVETPDEHEENGCGAPPEGYGIAQRHASSGGQPPVVCGKCNATFTGPMADKWFLAHRQASHGAVIWVR